MEKEDRIEVIKNSFSNMYGVLYFNCSYDNRETLLAREKLEEAQFWAIKGIEEEAKHDGE